MSVSIVSLLGIPGATQVPGRGMEAIATPVAQRRKNAP